MAMKSTWALCLSVLIFPLLVHATDYSRLSLEEILPEVLKLYENQRIKNEQLDAEFVQKIRPAGEQFSFEQLTDQTKFNPQEMSLVQQWGAIEEETHSQVSVLMDRLPVSDEYIAQIMNETRNARLLNLAKLVSGEITYGGYARNMNEAMSLGLQKSAELEAKSKIPSKPYSILDEPGYYGPGYTKNNVAVPQEMPKEDKGFFSSLGDALLNRIATGGSGRTTWMFDGGTMPNTTSTCRSLRNISGQLYTFQGPCPVGYAPAF